MTDPLTAATEEIDRLHQVIEGWFRGTLAPDRYEPDFVDALHPDFECIQPSGALLSRADLVGGMQQAHGTNPDFRITIEAPRLIATWPGLILAGYIEAQTGARNSAPENRRRSTALFTTGPRLLWRHLQETGLDP